MPFTAPEDIRPVQEPLEKVGIGTFLPVVVSEAAAERSDAGRRTPCDPFGPPVSAPPRLSLSEQSRIPIEFSSGVFDPGSGKLASRTRFENPIDRLSMSKWDTRSRQLIYKAAGRAGPVGPEPPGERDAGPRRLGAVGARPPKPRTARGTAGIRRSRSRQRQRTRQGANGCCRRPHRRRVVPAAATAHRYLGQH